MKARLLSYIIYFIGSAIGVLAFIYPFLMPDLVSSTPIGTARMAEMPLLLTVILGLSVMLLLFEVQRQAADTKLVALLGVLVAINAALRFIEIAIPGPGGFSLIFFLIILTGYIYGGRFGFLMGSLTLLVSAMVTGGVGPWLPGQMLVAGWIGMSAPLMRVLIRPFKMDGRYGEVILLAFFAGMWGFLYGGIMNLWSWPFISGPTRQSWAPGISIMDTVDRYTAYYLITSLAWDMMRAVASSLLVIFFAKPTLRALRRFQHRFKFDYSNAPKPAYNAAQPDGRSREKQNLPKERVAGYGKQV